VHEMSIMTSLLRAVEGKVREVGAVRVTRLRIVVGKLSGIEPDLLETAFEFLSPGTVAEGASFEIRTPGLQVRCNDCQRTFELDEIQFACPECGGFNVEIQGGDELLIEEMEVDFASSSGSGLREDSES